MRTRFRSSANFQSTIICSPKNWMNWDMQPAGCVICRKPKKVTIMWFLFFFFGCLFSDWAHTLSLTIQMCPAAFRPSFRGAYSGWWRWHSRLGKRWPARFLTGEGRPSCPHRRPPVENTGLDTATGVYKAMTGGGGGERNRYNVRYEPFQICIIKLA